MASIGESIGSLLGMSDREGPPRPVETSSLPGVIIGSLLGGSSYGQNLFQNVNQYRQQQYYDQGGENPAVAPAVRQLERIGTPEALGWAERLTNDPQGAHTQAANRGGWPTLVGELRAGAKSGQIKAVMQEFSQLPGEKTERGLAQMLFQQVPGMTEEEVRDAASRWEEAAPEAYKPQSTIAKLIQDRDIAIQQGRPQEDIDAYDAAILKAQQSSAGITLYNDDGTPKLQIGGTPGGLPEPTKGTITKQQNEVDQITSMIARQKGVRDTMERQFYESGFKLWAGWEEFKEKHLKGTIALEDEAQLDKFWQHDRRAWEDHNLTMKFISGAAVNPQESARVRRQMIDPGDNWYSGDGPSRARNKIEDGIRISSRHKARVTYALTHPGARSTTKTEGGVKYNIGLDQIHEMIVSFANEEWDRLERGFPELGPDELKRLVNSATVHQFGVTYDDVRD